MKYWVRYASVEGIRTAFAQVCQLALRNPHMIYCGLLFSFLLLLITKPSSAGDMRQ
jgi:hypothetical protein